MNSINAALNTNPGSRLSETLVRATQKGDFTRIYFSLLDTPLQYRGNMLTVQVPPDAGASPAFVGWSALGMALWCQHTQLLEWMLVRHRADPNKPCHPSGKTPLELALELYGGAGSSTKSPMTAVQLLLNAGVDLQVPVVAVGHQDPAPVLHAVLITHGGPDLVPLVRRLLNHGADVNAVHPSDPGQTPLVAALHHSTDPSDPQVPLGPDMLLVNVLLDHGADANTSHVVDTALRLWGVHEPLLRALAHAGAPLGLNDLWAALGCDPEPDTGSRPATAKELELVFKTAVDRRTDHWLSDGQSQAIAAASLHGACLAGDTALFRALVTRHRIPLHRKDHYFTKLGDTLTSLASGSGSWSLLTEVRQRCGPRHPALNWFSALTNGHVAAVHSWLSISHIPRADELGEMLPTAIRHGWVAMTRMILQEKARRSAQSYTYLPGAAGRGHITVLQVLIDGGLSRELSRGTRVQQALSSAAAGYQDRMLHLLLGTRPGLARKHSRDYRTLPFWDHVRRETPRLGAACILTKSGYETARRYMADILVEQPALADVLLAVQSELGPPRQEHPAPIFQFSPAGDAIPTVSSLYPYWISSFDSLMSVFHALAEQGIGLGDRAGSQVSAVDARRFPFLAPFAPVVLDKMLATRTIRGGVDLVLVVHDFPDDGDGKAPGDFDDDTD